MRFVNSEAYKDMSKEAEARVAAAARRAAARALSLEPQQNIIHFDQLAPDATENIQIRPGPSLDLSGDAFFEEDRKQCSEFEAAQVH